MGGRGGDADQASDSTSGASILFYLKSERWARHAVQE